LILDKGLNETSTFTISFGGLNLTAL
jgi:hypothetical protein